MWAPLGGCSGHLAAHTQASLQTWDVFSQQPSEMALKLFTHKCVNNWANAAVQIGYVPCHVEGKIQTVLLGAQVGVLVIAGELNSSKKADDIVRSPAGEKSEYDDKYELNRAAFLFHTCG